MVALRVFRMTHPSGVVNELLRVTASIREAVEKPTWLRVRPCLQGRKAAYWYARGGRQRGHDHQIGFPAQVGTDDDPTTAASIKWAVAAKELGFPKQNDGKRIGKEWRKSQRLAVNRPVRK